MSITNEEQRDINVLSAQMRDVIRAVDELTRTIRGHNGYVGMVTQLALTERAVSELTITVKSYSDNITELNADVKNVQSTLDVINNRGCSYGQDIHAGSEIKDKEVTHEIKQNGKVDAVTWAYLREKFTVPVILAIILAVLSALPKILQLLTQ